MILDSNEMFFNVHCFGENFLKAALYVEEGSKLYDIAKEEADLNLFHLGNVFYLKQGEYFEVDVTLNHKFDDEATTAIMQFIESEVLPISVQLEKSEFGLDFEVYYVDEQLTFGMNVYGEEEEDIEYDMGYEEDYE